MTSQATAIDSTNYPLFDPASLYAPKEKSTELGRNEFITLLVAQMENQNPLEPMKDQEFVAQLATFSSLEQLIDLNSRMDLIASGQDQLINSQSLTLIGREIVADTGGKFQIDQNGQADTIVLEFGTAPVDARVEVLDANGKVIDTIHLDDPSAGRNEIAWDAAGFAPGEYRFKAYASDGKTESAVTGYVSMTVDGVNLGSGGIALVSGDRVIDFASVIEIRMPQGAPASHTSGGGAFTGVPKIY